MSKDTEVEHNEGKIIERPVAKEMKIHNPDKEV